MKLKFDIQQVAEHLRHAQASDTHRSVYGDDSTAVAGLWWVKDSGTYIMSNGTSETRPPVVYAKGLGEDADRDLVDAVCGGDDFVEFISYAELESITQIAKGRKGYLVITPTASQMSITVEMSPVRTKKIA
jgi:hypothetical protein